MSRWIDVVLLVVVLAVLVALLAWGMSLQEAIGVLTAAGLFVPGLRRRLSV
ncbi:MULTISPECIES: hypothetical protein [unclassified Streptomyces]|uniref:hypothetical protein n=1 Tax=unclassified Streptomyces TaxID=2593676 RepID=UPI0034497457